MFYRNLYVKDLLTYKNKKFSKKSRTEKKMNSYQSKRIFFVISVFLKVLSQKKIICHISGYQII